MEAQIINTTSQVDGLVGEWKALVDSIDGTSIYDTPKYNLTAFKHYCSEQDELRIVTFREEGKLVGLVPLYLTTKAWLGRRSRYLSHLGNFDGDCPGIIALDQEKILNALFDVLISDSSWEIMELPEQDLEDNALIRRFKTSGDHIVFDQNDSHRFLSNTTTDFSEYFRKLSKSAKKEINRKINKNNKQSQPFQLECHHAVGETARAIDYLNRYIKVEESSWKVNEGIGIGNKPHSIDFHREFIASITAEKIPSFWFLVDGQKDIASLIAYHHQRTLYMAHTTFDPAYSEYSPGLIATKGLLEYACSRPDIDTYDPLATPVEQGRPRHKTAWATHHDPIQTRRITILRKRGMIGILARIKQLKDWVRSNRQ